MARLSSARPLVNKVLLLTVLVLGFCAPTARAQLFLEEGKVVLAVSGSERVNKHIVVNNTSSEPINVKVYWEDFEYLSPYDGAKKFTPAGTSKNSASGIVSFFPQTFQLPAFGKQQIDYSVSTPEDMSEGHYGVLFFEKAGDPIKTDAGISIVTRVGCLFFIEPKEKNKTAVIENMALNGSTLVGRFSNQGNVIMIPRTTYNVMDKEGLVADRGEVKKHYVPPGVSASWEVPLPKTLGQGEYTLLVNADLDEGDAVVKEMQLIKDAAGKLSIENVRD